MNRKFKKNNNIEWGNKRIHAVLNFSSSKKKKKIKCSH